MKASVIFRLTNVFLLAWALSAPAAPAPTPALTVPPLPAAMPAPDGKVNVLILGDSLALCGFGKRLDTNFRGNPEVNATFTYMTCGTNPLSWLRQKPYSSVRTQCGYWSIESAGQEPREMEDVYGMTARHTPKPHLVPKLEDLLNATQPDVLVVQTGGNLFGLFPDAKTVKPSHHTAELEKYLLPFKKVAIEPPSRVKKIYWINPPTSGRVGLEVQEFLFKEVCTQLEPEAVVIDSRKLVSYPYQHMEPDKEHFLGAQMDDWADKVYAIIERDLSAQPLASLRPLSEVRGAPALAAAADPVETPARADPVMPVQVALAEPVTQADILRAEPVAPSTEVPPPAEPPPKEPLVVRATLAFQSRPMPLQELLPYRESLVAYVYDVEKVLKGSYEEKQVLVMLPAHIGGKEQRLKYRIGKRYKLRLDPMEGTLWDTAKARDESGQINLQPFIRLEDKKRHPESRTR